MNFKTSFSEKTADFYVRHEYIIVLSFILIWQFIMLTGSNGLFIETDNYAHALRLADLIRTGEWKETLYGHDNCPFGQTLHFTRITDVFFYLTTLPFMPFMELKRAILFGGFLFNPVMACLSAAALIWLGRAVPSALFRIFGLFFYFAIQNIQTLFAIGRPDHHVLLNLFLILLSGCLIYGTQTQKSSYYKTAGIFTGLSIWTSPEGLLACFFIFAGMICAWLLKCQDMCQIRRFSQYSFISATICLVINPPMQGVFYPDNGRLSVLMAVVLGLAFLSFYIEELFEKKHLTASFIKRLTLLFFLALVSFLAALSIFGKSAFFTSPIPPELNEIWTSHISELKASKYSEILPFFYLLLFCFFSCFCALPKAKSILITFFVPLLMFFTLMFVSNRFVRPCTVFAVIALIFSLNAMQVHLPFFQRKNSFIEFSFLLLLIYANELHSIYEKLLERNEKAIIPTEYGAYITPKENGCLLSFTDYGSEIAWWTGSAVIGSNYHTNAAGIIDNHAILNGTDMNAVIDLLKKRHVHTIFLSSFKADAQIKKNQKNKTKEKSFLELLYSEKKSFCFIRPLTLSDDIKDKYRIYLIDFEGCENESK